MNRAASSRPVDRVWRHGRLEDEASSTGGPLLAADSWLVEDGRALGLELHRRRFERAVEPHGIDPDHTTAFWYSGLDIIPSTGDWFPRVELRGGRSPEFAITLRPAPVRKRTAVLAVPTGPDRRTQPTVKGPDLAEMARLRAEVQDIGADEAVICTPEGFVVEGAYSALLWWRGATLCSPSNDLPRIASVTAATVLTLATALGVETVDEAATPDDLDGLETWVLSSLHGIRIVTHWIDGPSPAEEPGRLAVWRERLGRLSRPIASLA